MAKGSYIRAYNFHSSDSQRLLAEAENNYSAVSTPASEELRRLLPSDYARRGMSRAAALAVLSVVRKRRLG